MGSLSDIWVKIVAQLRPMGTQVLMRQHGQLMACDGVEARVGITNDKLMRMAQDRLSNVETAFEKVFGHSIRVTMAVVPADQVVEPASPSAAPAPAPSPAAPAPPAPRPVSKATVVTAAATTSDNRPPTVEPSSSPEATAAPTANDWQSEGDLERSVKSFAQFFNGQIVNLDEDVTEPAPSPNPSTEPGPDVPF